MAHTANVSKQHTRRGAALVEMALVLPLLVVLTFGVLEYGWLFLKASQVNNAARNGARYAVSPDVTSEGQIAAHTRKLLDDAGIPGASATVSVSPSATPGPGNIVTVQVTVPYDTVKLFGLSALLPTPTNLRSSVGMAKEGV